MANLLRLHWRCDSYITGKRARATDELAAVHRTISILSDVQLPGFGLACKVGRLMQRGRTSGDC